MSNITDPDKDEDPQRMDLSWDNLDTIDKVAGLCVVIGYFVFVLVVLWLGLNIVILR